MTLEFNFLTSWKFTAQQSLGSFSGEVEFGLVGLSVGLKARLSPFPTSLGCSRDLGQMTLCLLSLQSQLPCQNPHIFYLVKMNIKGSHQGE